jgi:hypothetical protein
MIYIFKSDRISAYTYAYILAAERARPWWRRRLAG